MTKEDIAPVGESTHTVEQGECISSIAFQYGFSPQALWNDDGNAGLRKLRGNPNVLYPGDQVAIPAKRQKSVPCQTGKVHRFRRLGVPEKFRMQLQKSGKPRAELHYRLQIDGQEVSGVTDGDGRLEHWIPPSAKRGVLTIGDEESYVLQLGHLDPLEEKSGVVARLVSLGFLQSSSVSDTEICEAVKRFQEHFKGLKITGEIDEETRAKIREVYGS